MIIERSAVSKGDATRNMESNYTQSGAAPKASHPSLVNIPDYLTPEQRRAVELRGKDLCVSAGAGSGKTGVLVERLAHLVTNEGLSVSEILCITFTEKAAGEMKQRLIQKFQSLGLDGERQKVESAYISTIDSFCSRLLRENALEAGLDPDFIILEEYEAWFLQRFTAEELLIQWEETNPEGYSLLLEELHCRDLAESSVNLLARMRSAGLSPKDIPIEDVSSELNDTLKGINLYVKKIEALLTDLPASSRQGRNLEEVLAKLKLLDNVRAEDLRHEHIPSPQEIKLTVSAFLKEDLKTLKDLLERLTALYWEKETLRTKRTLREFLSQLFQQYQERKRKRSALDFSDLIEKTIRLLQTFPPLREEQREKFKHILVDEFQDTNNLQKTLLEILKGKDNLFVVGDAQQSIYGFRDADLEVFLEHRRQTQEKGGEVIHLDRNFRSRPEVISFVNQVFKGLWGGNDSTDWRPLIAASPFSQKEPPSIELLLSKGENLEEARKMEAHLLANRIKEIVENKELALTRPGKYRPITYGDFAILFRSFSNIKLFEAALEELGIPFFVVGGKGLYDAREVVDLVNVLQLIDNPLDDIKLAAVLRSPFVGINDTTLFWLAYYAKHKEEEKPLLLQLDRLNSASEIDLCQKERLLKFREHLEKLRGLKDRLPIASLIESILAETNYSSRILAFPDGRQGYANLRKFIELTREFEKREILAGLPQFLRAIRDLRVTETRESEAPTDLEMDDVVKILTIHKAKGLEFPVVAVADLGGSKRNQGSDILFSRKGGLGLRIVNPSTKKPEKSAAFKEIEQEIKSREEGEEERVLYVALTRAQEHLILSGSFTEKTKSDPLKHLSETLNLSLDPSDLNGEITFGEDKHKLRVSVGKEFTRTMPLPLRLSLQEKKNILQGRMLEVPHKKELSLPSTLPIPRQATHKDYIYSVTEIMCYHCCPRLYYLRYKLGLPSVGLKESLLSNKTEDELEESPRARLGNAAHRALELYRPSRPPLADTSDRLEKVILQALEETLPSPTHQEPVNILKGWVQNFYSSKEGQTVMHSKDVRHEIPFLFNYSGTPVRGKIDLLYSPEGKSSHGKSPEGLSWYLLDFKSSNSNPEMLKSYTIQMQLYSLAVKALFGTFPEQALLFFLPEARPVTIDISEEAMKRLNEWLKTFFTAEEKRPGPSDLDTTFPARQRESCRWCEYSKYCNRSPQVMVGSRH